MGEKDEKKKAKGVKGSTPKTITFDDYKQSLFSFQNLIGIKGINDKRKLIPDTTDTLPWGYKNATYEPMEIDDIDL